VPPSDVPPTPARWRLPSRRVTAAHVTLLVLLAGLKGVVWVGLTPMFLVADEPAHFDNVQYRAEHHGAPYRQPDKPMGRVMHDGASPEVRKLWAKTLEKGYYRGSHPSSDKTSEELAALAQTPAGRDTDGQATSIDYPGLYYRLAVPFYDAFRTSSVVTRITAVRILSLLFGLCAVLATYFAGRLVVADPQLALVAACVVALQPMAAQQFASVNNDAGTIGFAALLFFFQLRALATLPAFPSPGTIAGLVLSSVAIVATKPTGYGILPGTGVVLAIAALVQRRDRRVQIAAALAGVGAFAVAVHQWRTGWTLVSMLPGDAEHPGQHGHENFLAFLSALDPTYLDYLLRSAWGQYGWLDFSMSFTWIPHLRSAFFLIEIGTVVAFAAWSLRALDRPYWQRGGLFAFSVATAMVGVTFILYVEHRFRLTGVVGVIQGRNFLYVLPAFAIWSVVALAAMVPARMRGLCAAIIFCGAMCVHLSGLINVMKHHYAR
jgi:hypothetical protein